MSNNNLVYLIITNHAGRKKYYIGKSVEAILDDVKLLGWEFERYTYQTASENSLREIGVRFLDEGKRCVFYGVQAAYMLQSPPLSTLRGQ